MFRHLFSASRFAFMTISRSRLISNWRVRSACASALRVALASISLRMTWTLGLGTGDSAVVFLSCMVVLYHQSRKMEAETLFIFDYFVVYYQ
jgi:hypothetical protein